jgi:hypothetical protein
MKVVVLLEAGYEPAMRGLALSFRQPLERMPEVAQRLVGSGEPHCKFRRMIKVWLEVTAPWYWWRHLDTYNLGADRELLGTDIPDWQSSSTMHTLLRYPLGQTDFEQPVDEEVLAAVNKYIAAGDLVRASNHLPGGYLYTRVMCWNYTALSNVIGQRRQHKLPEWQIFCEAILAQVQHPEFLR